MNGNRIWILATTLIIAAVLILGWFGGVSPLLTQAGESDSERDTVALTNDAQTITLAAMKERYEHIEELRAELEELRVSVPDHVDSDFVYGLLSSYQTSVGITVASITTGEAVLYGAPAEGTEGQEASGAPVAGALATNLYTVPVTVTFEGVLAEQVLAFVDLMQTGSRLFLVTSVTGNGEGGETGSATITAYMFIVYDGTVSQTVEPVPEPAPEPTETPTPEPTETTTP